MVKIIRPSNLKTGDVIGVIAPGSPTTLNNVNLAKRKLEELGFGVKMGDSCYSKNGYLAGEDELRAKDVNNMFLDDKIKGIICLRGGYGTTRILDLINYKSIKKHPKVFVGYSDITALHIAINQICKMVTYHGPMAGVDMLDGMDDFTKKSFFSCLGTKGKLNIKNPPGIPIKSMCSGTVKGKLIGGNLSLIVSTLGTPYEIDTRGKILFIEEVGERPYVVDRSLTQLKNAGKLRDAEGVVLGDFKDCIPLENEDSQSLDEVFEDIIKQLNKPTIFNLKAGHCVPMITLPVGLDTYLDADKCQLIINNN
ncbi:LD-carboxypeptidase [Vallitalea sediminicola]